MHYNNKTITDSQEKSNIFNNYLIHFNFIQEDLSSLPELMTPFSKNISYLNFSRWSCHNLNPHKATGLDGIPAYFLKGCLIEIAPILALIFQCSIQ